MNVPTLETRAVLSHAHSELMTREDLRRLTCPSATATFRPIPHYELVTALAETLLKRQRVAGAISEGRMVSVSQRPLTLSRHPSLAL